MKGQSHEGSFSVIKDFWGFKTESIKMSLNVTQDVPQMSPKVLIKKLL